MNNQKRAVRGLHVVGPGGTVDVEHNVACPEQGRTVDFARCCSCHRRTSLHISGPGATTIECRTTLPPVPNGRVDVAEAAARARLLDLVGSQTTCVRPELGLEAASALFSDQSLRAAPVVDPDGRLVGLLSRTDLAKRAGKDTVGDVMTTLVHGLPEEAPVAYAISLMARDAIHEVPLVDAGGRVVGMISATDALRWVAQALGYVMP